ncbi:hypothetical protein COH20_010775 [Aspergillus flavus]|nr:uncharacterized protein G4B84_001584 [Aspergillus flavus NRRL3357]QMW26339.1 hypothetical protein G4B84_001584 [Aspergillus flavus NRRL3357]RAQ72511.1 hypothetical protein COH21_011277 [Aspergillus flavus]RAQ76651.1 hypothetical protein COH20_010775 [Aspergillus flavus]
MSTIEELESLFPEDPTTPSLGLIASNGGQITLPYSTGGSGKPIAILGSGCRPSKLESDDAHAPFNAKTALSDRSLKESVRFRIEDGALSKFHKAITSSSHATAEHLSISGCGRVGGKFLGASASGRYNKAVSDNGHELKASIQASIRTGTVYIDEPRFSLNALAETHRSRSKPSYFSEIYGEYYVASLQLGADAGLLASSAFNEHIETESLDVKGTVHILWWDIEKSIHTESHSSEFWSQIKVTGFDTLTGEDLTHISPQGDGEVMNYVQRVTGLEARVRQKMDEFALTKNKVVDWHMCKSLCEAGLVAEITLLPYSQVRDYVTALNERDM